MSWNLNSDRPIFVQIMERIQADIVSGVLAPGSRLPSVRELASSAAVNPNTMQRALSELERMELLYTERTSGRFITEDTARITALKQELAEKEVRIFMQHMEKLGLSENETLELLKNTVSA